MGRAELEPATSGLKVRPATSLRGARRRRERDCDHSRLDLAVAVCTHEHALLDFGPIRSDRLPCGHADRERLRRWIHMMEVKVQDASVISANSAASSRLIDKDPLDPLKPARDRFPDA